MANAQGQNSIGAMITEVIGPSQATNPAAAATSPTGVSKVHSGFSMANLAPSLASAARPVVVASHPRCVRGVTVVVAWVSESL